MAEKINKLTARTVSALTKPGRHGDGGGLYLVIDKNVSKRWVFLYRREGRLREMGLGGLKSVSLSVARAEAAKARSMLQAGQDPISEKQAEPSKVPTFGEMTDDFLEAMAPQFRNEKHLGQWKMTLTEYAAALRPKAVDVITTDDVLACLKPIWQTKPETASRLRGRIERVLDAAKARGLRSGENPALWRGHLSNLLPKPKKLSRGHHAALPFTEVAAFVNILRSTEALSALALEFTILTASRTGEALGATWSEIDMTNALWTVPGNRMKGGRIHRVPLVPRALAILTEVAKLGSDPKAFVFPGQRPGRPLSNTSMEMLLRRKKMDVTVHGFRSTFRDWAGEATHYPRELAEAALAHVVGDETERAYRRGDALAKRLELMQAWAEFCDTLPIEAKPPTIFD